MVLNTGQRDRGQYDERLGVLLIAALSPLNDESPVRAHAKMTPERSAPTCFAGRVEVARIVASARRNVRRLFKVGHRWRRHSRLSIACHPRAYNTSTPQVMGRAIAQPFRLVLTSRQPNDATKRCNRTISCVDPQADIKQAAQTTPDGSPRLTL